MSQLSIQQQVRGIVVRAKFSSSEPNDLVQDVTQLDVDAVVQCIDALKCSDTATLRDKEKAGIVLDAIERTRRIAEQINPNSPCNRIARYEESIEQSPRRFGRSNLK